MTNRKSYKTVLRLKGIRPVKIERTVKRDGDVELLPVRGTIVHQTRVDNVVRLSARSVK